MDIQIYNLQQFSINYGISPRLYLTLHIFHRLWYKHYLYSVSHLMHFHLTKTKYMSVIFHSHRKIVNIIHILDFIHITISHNITINE